MLNKQCNHSLPNAQKGSALILVLLVTTILLIIGTVALKISDATYESSDLDEKKSQALYVAESALSINRDEIYHNVEKYIEEKSLDPNAQFLDINKSNIPINKDIYDLKVTLVNDESNEFQAIAIGRVKAQNGLNVIKKVIVKFTPDNSKNNGGDDGGGGNPNGGTLPQVYQNAVFSNGTITVTNNADVKSYPATGQGNICTNGNLILDNKGEVQGNVLYGGVISGVGNITGTKQHIDTPVTYPLLDENKWKQEAGTPPDGQTLNGDFLCSKKSYTALSQRRITGNLTIENNANVTVSGIIWVDGSFTIGENVVMNGNGSIVSKGSICIGNNTEVNKNENANIVLISLISGNDALNIEQNVKFTGVLYAPNGTINVENKANIFGSVVGQEVFLKNNAILTYNTELPNSHVILPGNEHFGNGNGNGNGNTGAILPGFKIIEWKES